MAKAQPRDRPHPRGVDDFLAAVPDATRRGDAQTVCDLMKEVTGLEPAMWGPSIVGFGSTTTLRIGPCGRLLRRRLLAAEGQPVALRHLRRRIRGRPPLEAGPAHHRQVVHLREAARRHRPRRAAEDRQARWRRRNGNSTKAGRALILPSAVRAVQKTIRPQSGPPLAAPVRLFDPSDPARPGADRVVIGTF